jgi:tetratricopeptide (TPR) repeat protein
LHLLSPHFVYQRQRRSADSFGLEGMAEFYHRLARRDDLPPLYITYPPSVERLLAPPNRPGTVAVACRLQHPLCRAKQGTTVDHSVVDWYHEIRAGDVDGAIYDPVDRLFLPIADFDAVQRTGPNVELGSVRLSMTEPVPETASYFGLLADLSDATLQLRKGDWERTRDCYEAVLETPYRLTELLSTGDLAGLYYGAGVAHYHTGDQEGAIARWTLGVRHCPDEGLMRFNLAAALLEAGRPLQSARQSIALLRRQPEHEDGWHNLAVSLLILGRTDDAAAAQQHAHACLAVNGELSAWLEHGRG